MIFILNTSFDPHFCALLSMDGEVMAQVTWEERKRDGEVVHAFFQTHIDSLNDLVWCGGISGPGGFSSLRAASVILNTLAWKQKTPVRVESALRVAREYIGEGSFLLNSFGQSVFVCDSGMDFSQKFLSDFGTYDGFVGFLPEAKQLKIKEFSEKVDTQKLLDSLFQVLKCSEDKKSFVPEYFFEAVQ